MKKYFLTVTLLVYFSITADAKIRRVGYFGSPVAGTDYNTFALANAAAVNNDTILIFPGATCSGDIAKKLIIIGTGNWLDPNSTPKGNANMQAFQSPALGSQVYFKTGSAGSVIMGLYFAGSSIYVGADNITIRRNRYLSVNMVYNANAPATPIVINNLTIIENYELTLNYSYNIAGFGHNNLNISNNFMESLTLGTTNVSYNGLISQNVWAYDATAATNGGTSTLSANSDIYLGNGAFLFANNILCSYTNASAASNYNYFIINGGGNSVFNDNVTLQSYNNINMGAGVRNVVVPLANVSAIFQDFPAIGTNSADNRYRLKTGSPALQANRPGSPTDAGMYGGSLPYKMSTIPPIPTIYSMSSPQGNNPTGNTIQINLSTRGNN